MPVGPSAAGTRPERGLHVVLRDVAVHGPERGGHGPLAPGLLAWKPPDEADFTGFFGFADGTGGVALIEVDTAETLQRVIAPWTPWLRFDARAIMPIETSAAIAGEGVAFRAGVS